MQADRSLDVRCHVVRAGACDPQEAFIHEPKSGLSYPKISGIHRVFRLQPHSTCVHHCGRRIAVPHTTGTTMSAVEKTHPVQVSLFGIEAIVKVANALANLVQQSNGMDCP